MPTKSESARRTAGVWVWGVGGAEVMRLRGDAPKGSAWLYSSVASTVGYSGPTSAAGQWEATASLDHRHRISYSSWIGHIHRLLPMPLNQCATVCSTKACNS